MVIKDSAAAEQAKNRRGNDSRADISKKIAERGRCDFRGGGGIKN